jgi:3'(2'), 5'-bisphosphate nucleotidase
MHQHELATAIEIVSVVCGLTRRAQERIVSTGDAVVKRDRSPVTIADLAVQIVVSRRLAEQFPKDPLMAEEDSAVLAESTFMTQQVLAHVHDVLPGMTVMEMIAALERGGHGGTDRRYWVLDPIDGTKGFLRGDQYAIALALIDDGDVVVGVLGCPNLPPSQADGVDGAGRIFAAVRGQGTLALDVDGRGDETVSVDQVDDPSRAVVCESVEAAHAAHSLQARISERLGVTSAPYRIDSQCKYAAVARGDASIYLRLPRDADYREKTWDHAAGSIVVEEAGGKVTDLDGQPLDCSTGRRLGNPSGIVCTNGRFHDRVLEACRAELGI